MTDPCTSSLCLNLATTAGFHAVTMGVLAGFASAAIILAVQIEGSSERHATARVVSIGSLFAAVLLFIIASFLYGTAAGADSAVAAQPASMVLATALLALPAIAGLFLGLVSLVVASLPEIQSWALRLVAALVPTFTMAYLAISAADLVRVQPSPRGYAVVCWCAIAISSVLVASALVRCWRRWDRRWLREAKVGLNHQLQALTWGSLASAVAGVSLFMLLVERPSLASVVLGALIVILASWVIFLLLFISSVHALHVELTLLRGAPVPGEETG